MKEVKKSLISIGILILIWLGFSFSYDWLSKEELRAAEDYPNWVLYENEQFGFKFFHPSNVRLVEVEENDRFRDIDFKYFLSIEDERGVVLGKVGYIDSSGGPFEKVNSRYVFIEPTGLIYTEGNENKAFSKNCPQPFFGNESIPSARTGFGDGGWGLIYNLILLSNGDKLVFHNMYSVELRPEDKYKESLKEEELWGKILETIEFFSAPKPVEFECRLKV